MSEKKQKELAVQDTALFLGERNKLSVCSFNVPTCILPDTDVRLPTPLNLHKMYCCLHSLWLVKLYLYTPTHIRTVFHGLFCLFIYQP